MINSGAALSEEEQGLDMSLSDYRFSNIELIKLGNLIFLSTNIFFLS